MGAGFARELSGDAELSAGLTGYRRRARERNLALMERINPHLPDIAIDYEKDVVPLTPAGSATERHIISAYVNRAIARFEHPDAVARFWAATLRRDKQEVIGLLADRPRLEEVVRARLVKRGGIGYEQPSADTFPPLAEFVAWVRSCDAVPMITWLDGTSGGEKDPVQLLEYMAGQGCAALNIIPDRNWNISDRAARAAKVANLAAVVKVAEGMGLPINIGTEMNKLGLPFVDDLGGEILRRHKDAFLRGARIMVGHTLLSRYAGLSYAGPRAESEFADVHAKNAFFAKVGGLPPLTRERAAQLEDMGADRALDRLTRQTTGSDLETSRLQ
jgi:hypothetical protein